MLKLTGAHNYGRLDYKARPRPREIEVILNGRRRIQVRLRDDVMHKQLVRLPGIRLKSLEIRVRSTYPGKGANKGCGFKEIELLPGLAKAAAADERKYEARPITTLVAKAGEKSEKWRFTTNGVDDGWMMPDHRVRGWRSGIAGFGEKRSRTVRTLWRAPDLHMRRKFLIPRGGVGELMIEMAYAGNITIWLKLALKTK